MKYCTKCQQFHPISKFHKNKSAKDGLGFYCAKCMRQNTADWRERNLEQVKITSRINKRKSREKLGKEHEKETYQRWYKKNKEKKRQQVAKYRKKNKKKIWAQNKVNKAVKSGRLIRPDICPICNEEREVIAHHHDYNKPLDVVWMCRSCHGKEHSPYFV